MRQDILRLCLRGAASELQEADLKAVAKVSDGFTPADLKRVVNDAKNSLAAQQLEKAQDQKEHASNGGGGTTCMLKAVDDLKEMKSNVEYLIQSMYN